MLDLRQLEVFINVVKYGTFSKAAEKIYLTQPTISVHIAALEKDLSMKLFERRGKTIDLTDGGKMFYPLAVDIIETKEKAVNKVLNYREEVKGRLEIEASTTLCNYILPKIINKFVKKFNDVTFKVKQGNSSEIISNMLNYSTDLGIVGNITKNIKLEYNFFMEDSLVLITPNNRKYKAWKSSVYIEDVLNEKFVVREKGSGTRAKFERALEENSIRRNRVNSIVEFTSLEGVIRAVKEEVGIAVVSDFAARDFIQKEKIRTYKIVDLDLKRKLYIVNHSNRVLNHVTKKFKDFLLTEGSK